MNTRNLWVTGGVAALSLALIALPAPPANSQAPEVPEDSAITRLQQKLERLQAKLQGRQDEVAAKLAEAQARLASSEMALAQHRQTIEELENFPALADMDDDVSVFLDESGASWLGVELHEVTADAAKELKLPAERGVVLGSIVPDSPAAKAGLKENDVVTEINGQRVEGSAQFRRMIREVPAGRTVQLTVWRDGRAQTVNVTLGKAEERRRSLMITPAPGAPGSFTFNMPEIPMVPPMEWNGTLMMGARPRLGIDAEDLNGQLGTFFGTPDGEGILVREVNSGSPAEKAGLKAGDVITSVNGERVRSVGDLREKLAAKHDAKDKDQAVKLGVLRNKSEISLTVDLPAPAPRTKRLISHRTNI